MTHSIHFTSDLHLRHGNILKYQPNRKFKSVEDMEQAISDNWNVHVKPGDLVYVLGDLAFGPAEDFTEFFKSLNGSKFHIIGNHDKGLKWSPRQDPFIWHKHYERIKVKDPSCEKTGGYQHIVLSHYAFRVWEMQFYGSWHLYGHSHGTLPRRDNFSMDVGIDTHPEFRPYSYEEIKHLFRTHSIQPEDGRDK